MDFKLLIDTIPALLCRRLADQNLTVKYCEGCISPLLGEPNDMPRCTANASYADLIHPNDVDQVRSKINLALKNGNSWELSYRLKSFEATTSANGEQWVFEQGTGIVDNEGKILYTESLVTKPGACRLDEKEHTISYLAFYDPVTDLPNRNLIFHRISSRIDDILNADELEADELKAKKPPAEFGLIYIDLDRFKPVNDTYGHLQGDSVLKTIAQRCSRLLSSDEMLARIGGDEFLLLCELSEPKQLRYLAEAILQQIQLAIPVGGQHVNLSASVGISTFPDNGKNVEELVNAADIAMYNAKRSQCSNIHFAGSQNGNAELSRAS